MIEAREKRVLVTGGSGFMGTNLIDSLTGTGASVLNIDIGTPRRHDHRSVWRQLDLTHREDLVSVMSEFRPTHVYHLAARTDLGSDDVLEYPQNTLGTKHMVGACAEVASVRRVVFASSRLVCRIGYQPLFDDDYCPTTAYGESKVQGEKIVRSHLKLPFDWVIVRPTSIWGPWFGVPYRQFFDNIRRGRFVHPRHSRTLKSFGYVGNAVFQLQALMAAPASMVAGKTLYVGDYEPIEVGAFARSIAQEFGVRAPYSVPPRLLSVAARTGDILARMGWHDVPLTSFRLANLRAEMRHDFSEIAAVTGPLPFTTQEGIRLTVAWMRSQEGAGC
jgi:nucleoside-diphosphate-sugar epimerase